MIKFKRSLAIFLSLSMIISLLPGIVFAKEDITESISLETEESIDTEISTETESDIEIETETESESMIEIETETTEVEITGIKTILKIAELEEPIASQTVESGSSESTVILPSTLQITYYQGMDTSQKENTTIDITWASDDKFTSKGGEIITYSPTIITAGFMVDNVLLPTITVEVLVDTSLGSDTIAEAASLTTQQNASGSDWKLEETLLTITSDEGMANWKTSDHYDSSKLIVTELIIGASVTTIGYAAFSHCQALTTVTFDSNSRVTTIDDWAFGHSILLDTIIFPDTLESIGVDAFYGCNSLYKITIPASVTELKDRAFGYSKELRNVTFLGVIAPTTLLDIEDHNENASKIFLGSYNMSVITVPLGASGYPRSFSMGSGSTVNVTINAPLRSLTASPITCDFLQAEEGYNERVQQTITIRNTGLETRYLTQPKSNNYTSTALSKTTLKSNETATFLIKPKIGLSEGNYSETLNIFSSSSIPSATVSLKFKVIASSETSYDLTVQEGIPTNGSYSEGTTVTIEATPPEGQIFLEWTGDTTRLENVTAANTILVMPNSQVTLVATYKVDASSMNRAIELAEVADTNLIATDENISTIPEGTKFVSTEELKALEQAINNGETAKIIAANATLDLSSAVTALDNETKKLNDAVTLFKSQIKVGEYSVSGWKLNGTQLTITKNLGISNWKADDIYSSSKLTITELVIELGVTEIEARAFSDCKALNTATISETVTDISLSSFENCIALTNVDFDGVPTLSSIGPFAFKNCSSLKTIAIPASVTECYSYIFENCNSLETVAFLGDTPPYPVPYEDGSIFLGCSNLKTITKPTILSDYPDSFRINNNHTNSHVPVTTADGTTKIPVYFEVTDNEHDFINALCKATITGKSMSTSDHDKIAPWDYKVTYQQDGKPIDFTKEVGEYDIIVTITNPKFKHKDSKEPSLKIGTLIINKGHYPTNAYIPWPQVKAITYGTLLTNDLLLGESEFGTFKWKDNTIMPTVINSGYPMVFTSSNDSYFPVTQLRSIKVNPQPTYSISKVRESYDFGKVQVGYEELDSQLIFIQNTGTGAVTLNEPTLAEFEIGPLSQKEIEENHYINFDLRPETGLGVGIYDKTLTVTGNHGTSTRILVTFEVVAEPVLYNLTIAGGTPATGSYEEGAHFYIHATTPKGQVFQRWTGDTSGLDFIEYEGCYLTMPNSHVNLMASYAVDIIKIKETIALAENAVRYVTANNSDKSSVVLGTKFVSTDVMDAFNSVLNKAKTTKISAEIATTDLSREVIAVANAEEDLKGAVHHLKDQIKIGEYIQPSGPGWTMKGGVLTYTTNEGIQNWFDVHFPEQQPNITTIIIGEDVTDIYQMAFSFNALTTVIFDGTPKIKSIGDSAFKDCTSLKNITIPDTVQTIGPYAFNGCTNLETIIIPSSVQRISNHAFKDCTKLRNITMSNGIREIYEDAFSNCSSLESITFPTTLENLSENAFSNCKILKKAIFEGDEAPYNLKSTNKKHRSIFYNCPNLEIITKPFDYAVDYPTYFDTTYSNQSNRFFNIKVTVADNVPDIGEKIPVSFEVTDNVYDYEFAMPRKATIIPTLGTPITSNDYTVRYRNVNILETTDSVKNVGSYFIEVNITNPDFKHESSILSSAIVGYLTVNEVPFPDEEIVWPIAKDITIGDNLTNDLLENGNAAGKFKWEDTSIQPVLGKTQHNVVFMPGDRNYTEVTKLVSITTLAPIYQISANQSSYDFGQMTVGYNKIPSKTITITNTGTGDVTLDTPKLTNYTISDLTETVLHPDESTTFTICPKTALSVNTYKETLLVKGNNNTKVEIPVSFEVVEIATTLYQLTVNGGTPSGFYEGGASINIEASCPTGQLFKAWTGDTNQLDNVNNASTNLKMPNKEVILTAIHTVDITEMESAIALAEIADFEIISTNEDKSFVPKGTKFVSTRQMYALITAIENAKDAKTTAMNATSDLANKVVVLNNEVAKLNQAVKTFKWVIDIGEFTAPSNSDSSNKSNSSSSTNDSTSIKDSSPTRVGSTEESQVAYITIQDIEKILKHPIKAKDVLPDNQKFIVDDNANIVFGKEELTLSKEVLESIKENGNPLSFLFNEYAITIMSSQITNAKLLNLKMDVLIEQDKITFHPHAKGSFGTNLIVTVKVPPEMWASSLTLYYVSDENIVVDYGSVEVDQHGYVRFPMSHASSYFITSQNVTDAISNEEFQTLDIETSAFMLNDVKSGPKTGEEIVGIVKLEQYPLKIILCIAFVMILFLQLRALLNLLKSLFFKKA